MRIGVFDYRITSRNPSGGCHLALLRSLAKEQTFTVFSVEFENPDTERIEWVRVPVPRRPLALLFVSFHLIAPLLFVWHRVRKKKRFDLVQSVESNLGFGDLVYAHFSHTSYLKKKAMRSGGLRGWLRWVDHALHAVAEPFRFKTAKRIIVPSRGLKREIEADFPFAAGKIEVISNPISVGKLVAPEEFDRGVFRRSFALEPEDVVCTFCALGHFERKGLPPLMEAVRILASETIKVVVVGGETDLIRAYSNRAKEMGIESNMRFAGFQQDVRPFLWGADAFILPSKYETFSLAAYEAAAAGIPVIAPALSGIEDLLIDGETGFLIDPNAASITEGLQRLMQTPPDERERMGARARETASSYSVERFAESWRELYRRWPLRSDRGSAKLLEAALR